MIRFQSHDQKQEAAGQGIGTDALKYLNGQRLVVKIGGEVAADRSALAELVRDLTTLREMGVRLLLCHGGGPQISAALKSAGIEPQFRDGLRVTDEQSFAIAAQVLLGDINRKLVAAMGSAGLPALGLSGIDGGFIQVRPKAPDLGLVGEIVLVNPAIIETLWAGGYCPVIACLGIDSSGQAYNINADAVAVETAKAVKAGRLIMLTDVPGVYAAAPDPESLIAEIDLPSLKELRQTPAISGGMIPKIDAAINALEGGVPLVQICSGRRPHSLLQALMPARAVGTAMCAEMAV